MASINRSDMSADRRGPQGKGDMPRPGSEQGVRGNHSLWGTSDCCGAGVIRAQGSKILLICEKCMKHCNKAKK